MATPTYTPIETKTLVSDTAIVSFTGLNTTNYTDLVLVAKTSMDQSGAGTFYIRFNGDTGTNYSGARLFGDGSTAYSDKFVTETAAPIGIIGNEAVASAGTFIVNIQNYLNSTTFKTVISRSSTTAGGYVAAVVGVWRGTPATISSFDLKCGSTASFSNFRSGSTFTLYGIANAGDDSPKANGGDIYSDSTYWYHAFPMSGNFVPNQSLSADVLCIAGGGGGAGASGGGGGAGGIIYFASQSLTAQRYQVVIGGGGAKGDSTNRGINGGDSQFASLTVASGGGGGGTQGGTPSGINGGNGGGGTYQGAGGGSSIQSGSGATASYGNSGGGGSSTDGGSGGGGGAGGAGGNGNSTGPYYSGDGGIGTTAFSSWGLATTTGENISGTVYYAGGGGGGTNNGHTKPGGLGGGGGDGFYNVKIARNALPATGGGGYGAGVSSGNGASGLVIVRYLKA